MSSETIHIVTHPDSAGYEAPGHPEAPFRIRDSVAHLRKTDLPLVWEEARPAEFDDLLSAHPPAYLETLRSGTDDFDADTPRHENLFEHATRAAGAALQCLAPLGQPGVGTAFSLMRPPGHHAMASRAMGFCYLNSAAITALAAADLGFGRVAVFDFDVHHGNGTEAILHNRTDLRFCSVHQFPAYPGTGTKSFDNCKNFPVPPFTPRQQYQEILRTAFKDTIHWQPDLLVVSAGFDAYEHDPLAQGTLRAEDFHSLGCWLRESDIPFLSILEGGYSRKLPQLIEAYLRGCVQEVEAVSRSKKL